MEDNELKEKESHTSLEIGLQELVSKNILCSVDAANFYYVKDKRLKGDYSLYKFDKIDANICIKRPMSFT